jgi:hypothetical protein
MCGLWREDEAMRNESRNQQMVMFLQESSGIAQVVFPLKSEGNSLITLNIVSHESGKNDLGGIERKIFSSTQILDYNFF